jgi:hypothetical protein
MAVARSNCAASLIVASFLPVDEMPEGNVVLDADVRADGSLVQAASSFTFPAIGMHCAGTKNLARRGKEGEVDIAFHALDLAGSGFGDGLIVRYRLGHNVLLA